MTNHIKTLLHPFLQSKKSNWKIRLLKEWTTIMGSLAQNVIITKIYNDTIILGVYDSCWLQELYLLSPTLLATINQSLDQPRIKQIRFKQVGRTDKKNHPAEKKIEENIPSRALTHTEQVALNRIKNESLRTALQSFLMRCYREKMR